MFLKTSVYFLKAALPYTTRLRHVSSQCSIWLSTCQNIHSNLAFEEWIYNNVNLKDKRILYIWRNRPCIVIGRHQNIFEECDIPAVHKARISLARRQSGGGAVYHDLGNMCFSFFTDRLAYNRHRNLSLVRDVLVEKYNLHVTISDRDDLILNNTYKISGTGAKLGRNAAYHHFTLLLEADKGKIKNLLHTQVQGIASKSTQSVRMPVANICDFNHSITYESLLSDVVQHYSKSCLHKLTPEYIDPTNHKRYSGVDELELKLRSWDWMYGRNPAFTITNKLPVSINSMWDCDLVYYVKVVKGMISTCTLHIVPAGYDYADIGMGHVCTVVALHHIIPHDTLVNASHILHSCSKRAIGSSFEQQLDDSLQLLMVKNVVESLST